MYKKLHNIKGIGDIRLPFYIVWLTSFYGPLFKPLIAYNSLI